ncbi:unnamed protein product [Gongylonema pulchrum]|uniref:Secreted protein n=1 Tax=Gongylonema pulchrum TaxID=637853 RepID=A0A183E837_9BILA|nr:unnamed protein product [Gongylonema pulchrum]
MPRCKATTAAAAGAAAAVAQSRMTPGTPLLDENNMEAHTRTCTAAETNYHKCRVSSAMLHYRRSPV